MEFKGSRTEANLMAAFSGESMARNKYDFYAKVARSEGLIQVAEIFEETARNEHYHAKLWYRSLGKLSGTAENLKDAQAGEHYEWTEMYADFAKVAREEGFTDIANAFELVSKIEKTHEERFLKLLDNLNTGKVFNREPQTVSICLNCGHLYTGATPPTLCPVCKHPQAYFQMHVEDY